MVLDLYWSDVENNNYNIAMLEYKDGVYILYINETELNKATHHGCFGIGDIKFLKNKYVSKELFPFFKNRIPSKEHPKIDVILKRYNIKEYNEMDLLRKTEGRLEKDRYFCKINSIQQ